MAERFEDFEEFWPYYLREHARQATRVLHVAGSWLSLAALAFGVLTQRWWLVLLVPVIGYGAAWGSHLFIERNRPATFTYPLWSLRGDFRMAWLATTGRLGAELRKAHL